MSASPQETGVLSDPRYGSEKPPFSQAAFDPVAVYRDITATSHRQIQNKIDRYVSQLPQEEQEIARIRLKEVVDTIGDIQGINRYYSGMERRFSVEKYIDLKTIADFRTQLTISRKKMYPLKIKSSIPLEWVPSRPEDAISVATGLRTVARLHNIRLGDKAVDLGCGDGVWTIAMALAGFRVASIDMSKELLEQAQENVRNLQEWGDPISVNDIHFIHSRFDTRPEDNTHDVRMALQQADVMVCWPWRHEIPDRLQLFTNHAKNSALFILFHPGKDISDSDIDKFGLVQLKNNSETAYRGAYYTSDYTGLDWHIFIKK